MKKQHRNGTIETQTKYERNRIVKAYGNFVADKFNTDWSVFLISFMFKSINGGRARVQSVMNDEVTRVYATYVTRVARDPLAAKNVGKLPIWIANPDYPVYKHLQLGKPHVCVNDGLHMQAIGLDPARSRLRERFDVHFDEKADRYLSPILQRIHVEPVTHDPEYATDYAIKAFKNGLTTSDDVLILPRSRSELIIGSNLA